MNKKIPKISEDDYFQYSKQFQIWLKKKKNKTIDNLESKKCKKYFKKFVDKWNNNDLNEIFYDSQLLLSKYADLIKIKHNWNIKLNETEKEKINEIHQKVSEQTQKYEPEIKKKVYGVQKPSSTQPLQNDELASKTASIAEQKRQLMKERQKNWGNNEDEYDPHLFREGSVFIQAKVEPYQARHKREELMQARQNEANLKIKEYEKSENEKMQKLLQEIGLDKKYQIK